MTHRTCRVASLLAVLLLSSIGCTHATIQHGDFQISTPGNVYTVDHEKRRDGTPFIFNGHEELLSYGTQTKFLFEGQSVKVSYINKEGKEEYHWYNLTAQPNSAQPNCGRNMLAEQLCALGTLAMYTGIGFCVACLGIAAIRSCMPKTT